MQRVEHLGLRRPFGDHERRGEATFELARRARPAIDFEDRNDGLDPFITRAADAHHGSLGKAPREEYGSVWHVVIVAVRATSGKGQKEGRRPVFMV